MRMSLSIRITVGSLTKPGALVFSFTQQPIQGCCCFATLPDLLQLPGKRDSCNAWFSVRKEYGIEEFLWMGMQNRLNFFEFDRVFVRNGIPPGAQKDFNHNAVAFEVVFGCCSFVDVLLGAVQGQSSVYVV